MADRTVTVTVRGNVAGYVASMKTASQATSNLASQAVKHAETHRKSYEMIGKAALVGGTAAAAGLFAAVRANTVFSKSMSGVASVTGATSGELHQLREAALAAGADVTLAGVTASTAAEAQTELAKAGVAVSDILGGALKGSLSLAAAGQVEFGQAAEISAQAMNIFKLEGKDVGHIADVLAAGANKSAADVSGLGESLRQGGLVAAQTGLTLEETVGALSAFSDRALVGSDAGTSLKTMLQRLNPQSDKAAALMERLGLSAYDSQGQFIGMAEYAGELKSSLSGMSTEQRNAAMSTLFGSDAVRAANVLYEIGEEGVREYTKAVDDTGAAQRTAALQTDNLAGDLEALGGAFEQALIRTGEQADGTLRGITKSLAGMVNAYGEADPAVQKAAVGMLVVAAAVGITSGSMLLLLPRVAATKVAMGELGITGARAGTALRGLGLAGVAAGGIYVITEAAKALQTALLDTPQNVNELVLSLQDLARTGEAAGSLAQLTGEDMDKLAGSIERVADPSITQQLDDRFASMQTLGGSTKAFAQASADIEAVDAALVSLIASGGPEAAERAFFQITKGLREQGVAVDDLRALFPGMVDGLAGAEVQSQGTDAAMKNAKDATKNMRKEFKDATKDVQELSDAQLELNDIIGSFIDPLGAYQKALDDKKAAEEESARKTADATKRQGDSWEDYAQDVTASVDDYLQQLGKQVRAQQDWSTNMLKLSGRVSDGTLKQLERLGPEGAPLIAELVDASDKQLKRMEDLFHARSGSAVNRTRRVLEDAGPVLAAVAEVAGQKTADAYARKLADGTTTVAKIARRYGVEVETGIPDTVTTAVMMQGVRPSLLEIGQVDQAIRGIDGRQVTVGVDFSGDAAALASRRDIPMSLAYKLLQQRAQGGRIFGPGGPEDDRVPILASPGEYVVRARAVSRPGALAFLEAFNAGRVDARRLARGGPVAREVEVAGSTLGAGATVGGIAEMTRNVNTGATALARVAGALAGALQVPTGRGGAYGGVLPFTAGVGDIVQQLFGSMTVGGYANRTIAGTSTISDHALGKALDFMTYGDAGKGQRIFSYLIANAARLRTDNVIFDSRIWNSRGLHGYTPAVSNPTTRHEDHVHWDTFDRGGYLRPGSNVAVNKTGQRERVLDPAETRVWDRVAGYARGGLVGSDGYTPGGLAGPEEVWARFLADRPQQVGRAEMRAAQRERLKALRELTAAERELHKVRKDGESTRREIAEAERAVSRQRREVGKVSDALHRLQRRDTQARAPVDLGGYIAGLRKSADRTDLWRRDLTKIARLAGSDVAEALESMGSEGVRLVAKLADGTEAQMRRYARLTRRLAEPPQTLKGYRREVAGELAAAQAMERRLTKLARRGRGNLAQALAAEGGPEAARLARLALRDDREARRLEKLYKAKGGLAGDDLTRRLSWLTAGGQRGARVNMPAVTGQTAAQTQRIFAPQITVTTLPHPNPREAARHALDLAVLAWG